MTLFTQHIQGAELDAIVWLFKLDATNQGLSTYYFTPTVFEDGTSVQWDGDTYNPTDMEASGYEWSGRGVMPRPKIKFSDIDLLMTSLVIAGNDLIGSQLTRWRTYKRFLDGQPQADPTAHHLKDIYNIERKAAHTPGEVIEFELSSAVDQEGRLIPGRQVLRDTCTRSYRFWDATAGAYVYTNIECPYVGMAAFDANDQPTSADKDDCSRFLSGCKIRFSTIGTGELPTWAFPGVARVRV